MGVLSTLDATDFCTSCGKKQGALQISPDYCNNCGAKLYKEDTFCANCGKKVSVSVLSPNKSQNNTKKPSDNLKNTGTLQDATAKSTFNEDSDVIS